MKSLDFWLDNLPRKTGVPYPVFFLLIGIFIYSVGLLAGFLTQNTLAFLKEPKWVLLSFYGAFSGIMITYVYRKLKLCMDEIEPFVELDKSAYNDKKEAITGALTRKLYLVPVVFWLIPDLVSFLIEGPRKLWWTTYNSPDIMFLYYYLAMGFSAAFLAGMSLYIFPFGLNIAYKRISELPFRAEILESDWRKGFSGLKDLVTTGFIGLVIWSVFPMYIWGTGQACNVLPAYTPVVAVMIVLIPTAVLPHLCFHNLLKSLKRSLISKYEDEIKKLNESSQSEMIKKLLFFHKMERVERISPWLIDVGVVVEVLVVGIMHVTFVELITHLFS